MDDLYRDVLFDSIAVRAGFAQGLRQASAAIGHDLDLEARPLRRLDCAAVMQLRRDQLERTMEAAADMDPRSCPSADAIACKYWRSTSCSLSPGLPTTAGRCGWAAPRYRT